MHYIARFVCDVQCGDGVPVLASLLATKVTTSGGKLSCKTCMHQCRNKAATNNVHMMANSSVQAPQSESCTKLVACQHYLLTYLMSRIESGNRLVSTKAQLAGLQLEG